MQLLNKRTKRLTIDIDDTDNYSPDIVEDTRRDFISYKVYRVTVPTEEVHHFNFILLFNV